MRFLADECLAGAIVRRLREGGYDVANVPEELEGAEDSKILAY
jgi:predicted nuclease of predicted toxin-antitoxin system